MKKILWIIFIVIVIVTVYRIYFGDSVPFDEGSLVDEPLGEVIAGNLIIDTTDILILESFPVQVRVGVSGHLGDACTKIGEVVTNRIGDTFVVDISAERPSRAICAQVLTPFEESVALDVLGLSAGSYVVNVNGVTNSFELAVDNILER